MTVKVGQTWTVIDSHRSRLKSTGEVQIIDLRITVKSEEPIGEAQVERYYPRTGRYRKTWIKRHTLLKQYTLKHEQESLLP